MRRGVGGISWSPYNHCRLHVYKKTKSFALKLMVYKEKKMKRLKDRFQDRLQGLFSVVFIMLCMVMFSFPPWGVGIGNEGIFTRISQWLKKIGLGKLGFALRRNEQENVGWQNYKWLIKW
jgi:hypothetical protein